MEQDGIGSVADRGRPEAMRETDGENAGVRAPAPVRVQDREKATVPVRLKNTESAARRADVTNVFRERKSQVAPDLKEIGNRAGNGWIRSGHRTSGDQAPSGSETAVLALVLL
ncbi:hypothetical protein [Cohnella cholangitidis]|uniref:Uncharacterized protein n=1 Tax=Cohnella cholangitidis TaxID=2598458 RepID=A0A7G5BVV5_9BACL|nr:hypothetical protein [Cohnella cholangitidis]QMV41089.1 hypothetical protein FPL14_07690 [Cohnella cholangitidis]